MFKHIVCWPTSKRIFLSGNNFDGGIVGVGHQYQEMVTRAAVESWGELIDLDILFILLPHLRGRRTATDFDWTSFVFHCSIFPRERDSYKSSRCYDLFGHSMRLVFHPWLPAFMAPEKQFDYTCANLLLQFWIPMNAEYGKKGTTLFKLLPTHHTLCSLLAPSLTLQRRGQRQLKSEPTNLLVL